MWNEKQMEEYLTKNLKLKRLLHSFGVRDTAEKLAEQYGTDAQKARITGLIHDAAKEKSNEEILEICKKGKYEIDEVGKKSPSILHGYAGKIIANELMGITDEDCLNAIQYHTTGRKLMSDLEKIIYIADYIEPNRNFPGVNELREAAFRNLDEALLLAFDNTIKLVVSRGNLLHKDTVEARNYIILMKE